MERAVCAGWGWFVALGALLISLAMPLLWEDMSRSIISLVWKEEGMMECSELMESDGVCVKRRNELLINWAGNVKSGGQVTVFYPRTVVGVQSTVRLSKQKEVGVRVVGARHSWSRALLQIPQNTLHVSLISKDEATELSSVGRVEVQGDDVAEVEVGAGATLGQLAEQCRKSGWQVASAPVLPQVTVAGVAVSLSHGAGTRRPGLADSVTALTYIDARGEVQRLTEAEEVAVFLSSLGLLGIIVSLRVRLVPIERVLAPLQSPFDDLSLLLPRPGEPLPPEALALFEDSDYQQFFLPRSLSVPQSKLPTTGTFWKSEPGVEDQDWLMMRFANQLLSALVGGCKAKFLMEALKVRVMSERWISTVDALHPYCDPTALLPYCPKFRVTEFSFPILHGKDEKDFSLVQRAVWDALDIADALKKKEGIDGLTDHLDVRLVAPSHIPLTPYPKIDGVWAWAGVVLAASEQTPERDWKTLVESVVGQWASYKYQDGSLILPR